MVIWHQLWDMGYAPYCPHLSHFLHLHQPRPYEEWLDFDNNFIPGSDGLFRFAGQSRGADKEVGLAISLGIPVFTNLAVMETYFKAYPVSRADVYDLVDKKRTEQNVQWGGLGNDIENKPEDWVRWIQEYSTGSGRAEGKCFKKRMVHVAALAIAALEAAQ